jgi:hypothetical protein
MRNGWLVNAGPFRNDIALSKLSSFTKWVNEDFVDLARQRNGGGGGREKDLCHITKHKNQ